MTKINSVFCKACLRGLIIFMISGPAWADLSPTIENALSRMTAASVDSMVSVVIFAEDDNLRNDVSRISAASEKNLRARHQAVIEKLQQSNTNLDRIYDFVMSIPSARVIEKFWISPAVAVELPLSAVAEIENLAGVKSVIDNAVLEYIEPVENTPALLGGAASSHLEVLKVPALWRRGLTGAGRVVCSFDTGVQGDHPALASKWRGNHASSSSSWFGPVAGTSTPIDRSGHGTHTMGIMVGSTPTDSFGVAPSAEWISAAVVDQGSSFSATIADILSAFQWAVDPDGNPATVSDMPDVILNSWGVPQSIYAPCNQTFSQAINNVEAAGIIVVFSAGNEGPNAMSLRIPADNASTPLNTFSVGAINSATLTVADFSSRGPSACDQTSKKPEVVAPGVSIVSSYKDSTYRSMNGTSMAAPFIAGLAALLRQYNPDATVADVKNAIIQSCRDLGPAGEDNAYGYGLPDAEAAISFMPVPVLPPVYVDNHIYGGDGHADPGDTVQFFVRLSDPTARVDSVIVRIECEDENITILNDEAVFIFPGNINMSMNIEPFIFSINAAVVHGYSFTMDLIVSLPFGVEYDTLHINLTVGYPPAGNIVTHTTSRLEFSVSDFGQNGLGPNSAYFAGGQGFRFDRSENLLYESGIIVGRNPLQIASSVRDSLGKSHHSDFKPSEVLATAYPDVDGAFKSSATYTDANSDIPIPIKVRQAVSTYDRSGDDGFAIMRYFLKNTSAEVITNVYFGFMADFDLGFGGETVGTFEADNMLYYEGNGFYVGMLPVTSSGGMAIMENIQGKSGLSDTGLYELISTTGVSGSTGVSGDYMTCLSFGPYRIVSGDSVEVALILAAGHDMSELYTYAHRGLNRYYGVTAVEEHLDNLPDQFLLHQNYPNPFNPTTTITYELTRTGNVRLDVINMLGQVVTTLVDGIADRGVNAAVWDGTDGRGHQVASGVYFYRITTEGGAQTKKMMMLK